MGLGPSYQPQCKHCSVENIMSDKTNKVTYKCKIYKKNAPEELDPWWVQTISKKNEHIYFACDECISQIPDNYVNLFEHAENYSVHGM